jgi:hypothetical protein
VKDDAPADPGLVDVKQQTALGRATCLRSQPQITPRRRRHRIEVRASSQPYPSRWPVKRVVLREGSIRISTVSRSETTELQATTVITVWRGNLPLCPSKQEKQSRRNKLNVPGNSMNTEPPSAPKRTHFTCDNRLQA